MWKKKTNRSSTFSVETPNWTEEKGTGKYYRNDSSPWFHQINMKHHAMVSAIRWQTNPVLKEAQIGLT
jgi:hypothetical protein